MSEHTKTPWQVDKNGIITGGPSLCTSIAECYVPPKLRTADTGKALHIIAEQQANAEFICLAANCHDELRDTLALITGLLKHPGCHVMSKDIDRADSILAKAAETK